MATDAQLEAIRTGLRSELNIDLTNSLNREMQTRNEVLQAELNEIRQSLRMNISQEEEEEDNMDILIDSHMRDVTADPRPQMSGAGLSGNNKQFKDLSNHELHQIKKLHEKDHQIKPQTILDEPLGEIMNKCVNFLTFSFDGYTKALYEAEIMEDVYDDKSTYESIKVHLIALTLFIRDDENILYIGILLVFLSIIIYLVNITTS
jgi:hypothetical protein